jgi:hypothetical protein
MNQFVDGLWYKCERLKVLLRKGFSVQRRINEFWTHLCRADELRNSCLSTLSPQMLLCSYT